MPIINTRYQSRRHPVAAFLCLLIFGPVLLAGLTLVVILYAVGTLLHAVLTMGRTT